MVLVLSPNFFSIKASSLPSYLMHWCNVQQQTASEFKTTSPPSLVPSSRFSNHCQKTCSHASHLAFMHCDSAPSNSALWILSHAARLKILKPHFLFFSIQSALSGCKHKQCRVVKLVQLSNQQIVMKFKQWWDWHLGLQCSKVTAETRMRLGPFKRSANIVD